MANRLKEAHDLVARAAKLGGGRALLGLSGGKDSLATLAIACDVLGPANVECFFLYFVKGLRSVEVPLMLAVRRHGVRLHRLPHPEVVSMLRYDAFRLPTRGHDTLPKLTYPDIEYALRDTTGIGWVLYGHRAAESIERRGMLSACQGFNEKSRRCYPIWQWGSADVYAYLRGKRIPIPPSLGRRGTSGIDLRSDTLLYLKEHFPDDFAKLCAAFPLARAQLMRKELYPDATQAKRHRQGKRPKREDFLQDGGQAGGPGEGEAGGEDR